MVRKYLDESLNWSWWLPRSPDLTSIDSYDRDTTINTNKGTKHAEE